MTINTTQLTPVIIERASEQLRQERETFDQAKKQEQWWFILRLVMGFSSVVLLVAVMVVSVYILFNHADFPTAVVTSSGVALFADVLGMLIGVWKIALNPKSVTKLVPITSSSIPDVVQS
jgi:uncharacterized membrane protein YfcA